MVKLLSRKDPIPNTSAHLPKILKERGIFRLPFHHEIGSQTIHDLVFFFVFRSELKKIVVKLFGGEWSAKFSIMS